MVQLYTEWRCGHQGQRIIAHQGAWGLVNQNEEGEIEIEYLKITDLHGHCQKRRIKICWLLNFKLRQYVWKPSAEDSPSVLRKGDRIAFFSAYNLGCFMLYLSLAGFTLKNSVMVYRLWQKWKKQWKQRINRIRVAWEHKCIWRKNTKKFKSTIL